MGSSPKGTSSASQRANGASNGASNGVPKKKKGEKAPKSSSTTSTSSRLLRGVAIIAVVVFASLAAAPFLEPSSFNNGVASALSRNPIVSSLRGFLEKGTWDAVVTRLRHRSIISSSLSSSSSSSSPSSSIEKAACDPGELSAAAAKLAPLATRLVSTPFFRHFKVALRCECPFWPDDGTCSMSDCAVCECSADEVPEALRDGDEPRELASCPAARLLSKRRGGDDNDDDASVDREVEPGTRARLIAARGWRGVDNPWMAGSSVGEEEEGGGVEGGGKSKEEEEDEAADVDDDDDDDDDDEEEEFEDDEDEDEDEEQEGEDYSFIDLLKNPERYTGYSGPSARRVWDFVYSQSCFGGMRSGSASSSSSSSPSSPSSSPTASQGSGGGGGGGGGLGVCSAVQQTLYRVMSGVHASISAHIAAEFLLEPSSVTKNDDGTEVKTEAKWGPNLALFAERLSLPEHAERIENLRFAYAFVARALLSARPLLLAADYGAGGGGGSGSGSGKAAATETTQEESALVKELLTDPALEGVCAAPFDAARHLPLPSLSSSSSSAGSGSGSGGGETEVAALERELQAAFRNVTAVMDCVGCEKCRVWGKLQLMGVATALKVLVAERKASDYAAFRSSRSAAAAAPLPRPPPPLVLERNEVVALVNLFERLSRSMNTVRELQARLDAGEVPVWPAGPASDKLLRAAKEVGRAGGGDALAGALGVF